MIDAKITFLRRLENGLSEILTAADMEKSVRVVNGLLDSFDMTERTCVDGNDDLMDTFISSMRIQGRSEGTILRYGYIIQHMMQFVNTRTRDINVYHIRRWLAAEKERGIQESTLEHERQILSSYFGWLFREGLIDKNPVSNLGTIKVPKIQRNAFSEIELEKLHRSCKTICERAIIMFLESTGCRVSEMTDLNRNMVDLAAMECLVRGKGDKQRTVYLNGVACMILQEYLRRRTDDNEALFISKRGTRLTPDCVRVMLKNIAERAGVENVHPHRFRRTLATELARHGMPIQDVRAILGHEKLDTTMKYVQMCKDVVKANYRKFA